MLVAAEGAGEGRPCVRHAEARSSKRLRGELTGSALQAALTRFNRAIRPCSRNSREPLVPPRRASGMWPGLGSKNRKQRRVRLFCTFRAIARTSTEVEHGSTGQAELIKIVYEGIKILLKSPWL